MGDLKALVMRGEAKLMVLVPYLNHAEADKIRAMESERDRLDKLMTPDPHLYGKNMDELKDGVQRLVYICSDTVPVTKYIRSKMTAAMLKAMQQAQAQAVQAAQAQTELTDLMASSAAAAAASAFVDGPMPKRTRRE
jgi:hypothetical protein